MEGMLHLPSRPVFSSPSPRRRHGWATATSSMEAVQVRWVRRCGLPLWTIWSCRGLLPTRHAFVTQMSDRRRAVSIMDVLSVSALMADRRRAFGIMEDTTRARIVGPSWHNLSVTLPWQGYPGTAWSPRARGWRVSAVTPSP